jgi:large subunit ribosomal protein L7/L12
VTLEEIGPEKAKVGRVIRSLVQGLGLNEAVELINSVPVVLLEDVSKEQADSAKSALEAIGTTVSIKQI